MPRIAVTADLHYDSSGGLTSPERVKKLVEQIETENPDAVIIAGDLAHRLHEFEKCLACFAKFDVPVAVAVLAGNHDVWRDDVNGHSSTDLWSTQLSEVTRKAGAVWLEDEILRLGDVAIVGSMVWYDYSAIDPAYADMTVQQIAVYKTLVSNDAYWLDWNYSDPQFAGILNLSLQIRLQEACRDEGVRAVVVATHTPILEGQMLRKPGNETWSIGNAYFGNLTSGKLVTAEEKVRVVVSGHTHIGREGTLERDGMPPVAYHVVASDYGKPAYTMVEL